jgi:uncharacterized protein (TIGR02147 family)
MTTQPLFSYTDYRTFLNDYNAKKKEANPNWSMGNWGRKLGVSSTAVLSNVLNGKRNPGNKLTTLFTDYFKFSEREREYFIDLVRLKKAGSDASLSIALMEKMKKLNPVADFELLSDEQFNTISKWYYFGIREMINLPYFIEDFDWIAKQLGGKITATEAKRAIRDLLTISLLDRDENGKLIVKNSTFKTTTDIASEGLKRFHEGMINNALESIRKTEVSKRDISGRTINISEKNLGRLKEYIKDFRDKVEELFEESCVDSKTYQLNVQLFPLNQGIEKEELH